MKKLLLLFILGILTSSAILAQDIELMKKDGAAIENDTIHILTSNDSTLISAPVYVINNTTKTLDVKIKVYVKNFVSGSSASYCWGSNCFAIETSQPEASTSINSADTAKEFHSDFNPKKFKGTTELMYTFYNKNNVDDSASVSIYYEITTSTGIDILSEISESIKSYPNPVQNTLYIDYDNQNKSACNVSIYDIVGKKVKNQNISAIESKTEIDVSELRSGIYIWTFELDGVSIKSDKFIKR